MESQQWILPSIFRLRLAPVFLLVELAVLISSGESFSLSLLSTSQPSRREFQFVAASSAFSIFLPIPPAVAAGTSIGTSTPPLYNTAAHIPASAIENHDVLYGYVERVIDGDTIRARHIPDLQAFRAATSSSSSTAGKERTPKLPLANTTIVVRLYGVDAPETAKIKSETSQPFGEEAKQFTKDLAYHQVVAIRILQRDKYNRIIAQVDTLNYPSKDLSQELAARGLATMYTGKGAEYNGKLDLLRHNIQAAKNDKLGIWSLGDELVTPAQYKRQKKLLEETAPAVEGGG